MMNYRYLLWSMLLLLIACREDFLDQPPQGVLSEQALATEEGLQALLIGAYSVLNGYVDERMGPAWGSAATNWAYGDMPSDDSYKGGAAGECCGSGLHLETYQARPFNSWLAAKWRVTFEGISRANAVLQVLSKAELPQERAMQIAAEARFLRGHFYFEAKKIWQFLPWYDEHTRDFRLPNRNGTALQWSHIQADFAFAAAHLPEVQAQPGRPTRYAALAYQAKALLFEGNYPAAGPLLDDIIQSGRYRLLDNFHENFDADFNNHSEALFQIQMSVNDGAPNNINGNYGDILNFPHNQGPVGCCGFNQPSQNLVNAFKTDAQGLPMLEHFNDWDVPNDEGILSSEPFEPYTGPLDPRLDWTVGRRGIPFLDWGLHAGRDWIRDQDYAGPYSPKKRVFRKQQQGILSASSGWTSAPNALNYSLIRYADVLLWRAEVAVEAGELALALQLVNQVRERARLSEPVRFEDGSPAAQYRIAPYPDFPDQDFARRAVRFERRLELAMEGHRFFDLVHWGEAAEVLNAYVQREKTKRRYLEDAFFEAGTHEYFPIPAFAIEESKLEGQPTLVQNPGY
ncbi:MAG: RagB/SusD family nutrient uptake outer membrane protein [Bacteroidetes bacterium]|nr:MAG: RagB/SusD family nutrient uptake outer membrane protein [Bacteroidota bacterium]